MNQLTAITSNLLSRMRMICVVKTFTLFAVLMCLLYVCVYMYSLTISLAKKSHNYEVDEFRQPAIRPWSARSIGLPLSGTEDVLNELVKAGWKCTPVSVKNLDSNKQFLSQHDHHKNVHEYLVPNVVHYVWLGSDLQFRFLDYLSFLSVHRYIKPTYIFVYGQQQPKGIWWTRIIQEVNDVIHVNVKKQATSPSGTPYKYAAHESDVLRTQIIYKFGGIYLDSDVIVLKSFDPLRRYPTVMGQESSNALCNGIIISARGTPFIRMLLEQYDSYKGKDERWAYRSVMVPHTLAQVFPNYIHVEEKTLHHPSWREIDQLYDKSYDWSNNYAIHLWVRVQRKRNGTVPQSISDLDCVNTTMGQIGRHVYYGSQRIVPSRCNRRLSQVYNLPAFQ